MEVEWDAGGEVYLEVGETSDLVALGVRPSHGLLTAIANPAGKTT